MDRNFVIIAHIDHGKSTLADRFLEVTGTVSPHKMKAQYLDQLELERERGITIKMAPVRMNYKGVVLNLIDTPGHSDFSYEVSRALKAVEGAVLLVDATQGIQAQTLANLERAKAEGLVVIGALNKIDLNPTGQDKLAAELAELLGVNVSEIYRVSAKTGEGVPELLDAVIEKVPPPHERSEKSALIFSSLYDDHKGVVAFVRVFGGTFKTGDTSRLQAFQHDFKIKEVGYFTPELKAAAELRAGDIGFVATGIKDPDAIRIGDTIGDVALPGFKLPSPVVFVSLYPSESDDFDDLKVALHKLRLRDSSFSIAIDNSEVLGRGFQCGFLGRLHFEIVVQRLEREFGLRVVNSFPSVAYRVKSRNGEQAIVERPRDFPADYLQAEEPLVKLTILAPLRYLGGVLSLKDYFRLHDVNTETRGSNILITAKLPLAELILDFDDKLKSVSQGFASFSYDLVGYEPTELTRLDILVTGEIVPGLSRIVHKDDLESEGRKMVEKLKDLLPRQQFSQALQAATSGRIIARETIPALHKELGNFGKNGGDRTRKMKLWKKQQRGKARLKERGRVEIPVEVFRELLKR
ncbi:MAG: translation elongation factor 4 [Patescibacteria group bacterium]|nr:translation elongation factor 4 [Patescibacteria group bacterium]MCL5224230.1 translation elongation factor 4 [Patescibacteria group bacterium]